MRYEQTNFRICWLFIVILLATGCAQRFSVELDRSELELIPAVKAAGFLNENANYDMCRFETDHFVVRGDDPNRKGYAGVCYELKGSRIGTMLEVVNCEGGMICPVRSIPARNRIHTLVPHPYSRDVQQFFTSGHAARSMLFLKKLVEALESLGVEELER